MNSLPKLQRRFIERGEVRFKLGVRWCFWLLLMFTGALMFLLLGLGFMWLRENLTQLAIGVVLAAFGAICLAGAFFEALSPKVRRKHRMRVSRNGIEMAGIRIPWNVVKEISSIEAGEGRMTFYDTALILSPLAEAHQVAWGDGSPDGQRLSVTVNKNRYVCFRTRFLNVRYRTLEVFLNWARLQSDPNATDLRFESFEGFP